MNDSPPADDHPQLRPPDYHRCLDSVLRSPHACRTILDTLSNMTEAEATSKWSPWRGQQPPPFGPDVAQSIPAGVRVVTLQAALDSHQTATHELWQRLSDIMGIPVMQVSLVELIGSVGRRIDRLEHRVAELESEARRSGRS